MIEKKIRYDINIEKPSTTKPVKQGGVLNYLGKQKTVNAPRHWRSSPKHPIAHLAYITKDEEKILVDLNLYGSLKGRPNKGPSGIMSLNGGGGGGDGGSSGGDGSSGDGDGSSSGEGDSGPGGSDDGSGHGGPGGPGDSGPGGSDDGTGHGGPGPGPGADDGGYGGFGIGPNAEAEAAASNAAAAAAAAAAAEAEVDMSMPAMQTPAEKAQAIAMSQMTPAAMAGRALGMMTGIPGMGIVGGMIGSNIGRGVTGPSDDTQEQSSVQSGPAQSASDGGGGITTINQFAPLYNPTTGDNTADAMRLRLNALLVQRPTSYGIPAANQLSNYNLLDLVNLRR